MTTKAKTKKRKSSPPPPVNRTKVALFTWITPELDVRVRALAAKRDVHLAALVAEALEDVCTKHAKIYSKK